jgi:hypothetical protein
MADAPLSQPRPTGFAPELAKDDFPPVAGLGRRMNWLVGALVLTALGIGIVIVVCFFLR